jgi:NAD+ kinase
MIIALFSNSSKKQAKNLSMGIYEFLTNQAITVVVDSPDELIPGAAPLSSVAPESINFAISMGGDGTILQLVHKHSAITAPIFGINLGSLGFLADTPISDIYPSLQDLINGAYRIQERLAINGETASMAHFAVNDIVVHRAKNPCLIDLAIHVDGNYLNTFSADGVIIATPSGSTAYSLAAGGPILTPELNAIALTPISPHTLSNRPIVLMPKKEIQIQYISEHEPIEISFDGVKNCSLSTGQMINISASERKFRLVSLNRHDYFSTLRTKLGWTGKLRGSI